MARTAPGPVPAHCPELGACQVWTGPKDKGGYGFMTVDRRSVRVHRLVLEEALGHILLPGRCALHRCDNPACVRASHLFEGSVGDNNADRERKGRTRVGSRNRARGERANSKLTEADVLAIVAAYQGGMTQHEIARAWSVAQTNVAAILSGKTWQHLTRPIVALGRGGYRSNAALRRKEAANRRALSQQEPTPERRR